MTNLEALQSTVAKYPVEVNTFNRICIDRGLTSSELYAGKTQAFELANADVIAHLLMAANVTEGGFSVSLSDKATLLKLASGIYAKYGEENPLLDPPTVEALDVW